MIAVQTVFIVRFKYEIQHTGLDEGIDSNKRLTTLSKYVGLCNAHHFHQFLLISATFFVVRYVSSVRKKTCHNIIIIYNGGQMSIPMLRLGTSEVSSSH